MQIQASKQAPSRQQASARVPQSNAKPATAHPLLIRHSMPSSRMQSQLSRPAAVPNFSKIPVRPSLPGRLQTKLAVNTPGDVFEQEADRVAEQVMRMPEPQLQRKCACGGSCPDCQKEKEGDLPRLQMKSVSGSDAGHAEAPPSVHEVLRSPGRPLDTATRAFMEPRFGWDFSQVRVHIGHEAAKSARNVAARAFTVGNNIVFGDDCYRPHALSGRQLLAHELSHVLQQRQSSGVLRRSPIPIEELRRMRDDIDEKLLNIKLSSQERSRLQAERIELSRAIMDLSGLNRLTGERTDEPEYEGTGMLPGNVRVSSAPRTEPPDIPVKATQANANPPKASNPAPGGPSRSQAKSAKALGKSEARASTVPPPATLYRNLNPAATAEEKRVGARLNELAIGGRLREVRVVEGRREVPPNTADYAFILRDGSEIKADLYNPTAGVTKTEDIALHAQAKSRQADIVIVELPEADAQRALEKGHLIADAMIANANHSLKRIIVMSSNNVILNRSLEVSGRALVKAQATVQQRMATRSDPTASSQPVKVWTERAPGTVEEVLPGAEVAEALGRQEAKASALEGAAQIILSAQFASLENREVQKIFVRLHQLAHDIDTLRNQGYYVEVWGTAEVPDSIDIAAGATGVRDISQVVYFVDLNLITHRNPPRIQPPPKASDVPPSPDARKPQQYHGSSLADEAREIRPFPVHGGHHLKGALFLTYPPYIQPQVQQ